MLLSTVGCMFAFAALGQGCQSDTHTDAWRARCSERLALDAVACCRESSAVSQDRCTLALLEKMDAVENDLELLDAARYAGNHQLASQLLERLAAVIGNVVVAGADGAPANGLPVLRGTDTIRCDLRWSVTDTAIGRAANGYAVRRWTLAPRSTVAASFSGLHVEVHVAGAIELSDEEVPMSGGLSRLPTSADLTASWGEQCVRLTLDEACPWNRVTSTHLSLGLRPQPIDQRFRAELSAYPTVFVVLPFVMRDGGSATSTTGGTVAGTQIFPSYFGHLRLTASDAAAGPNCGDADNDGIPNLVERIARAADPRTVGECDRAQDR